ncbi:hypothetical protein PanWU01x14_089460 [Parasponia andersonii]|uniref:Uncharacterized protein n=1 Tax=Parasponia andersonii TaxID=3476 RepID=A0A2P5D7E1_PARAD|nr:hypothetical protein PanWU01x14_089460 [Parasponia andersonii]
MDCQHDLGIEIAAVNGVVPKVPVELAIPIPILHMLRDAGLGRVLENAPVPVLEVYHVNGGVKFVFGQRVAGRLPPLAPLQTALCRRFLLRSQPLARLGPFHPHWGRGWY